MSWPDLSKWWLVPPAVLATIFGVSKVFAPTAKPGTVKPGTPAPPPAPFIGTGLTGHLSDAFFLGLIDLARYFNSKGSTVAARDFLGVFNAESAVLIPSTPQHPTGSHVANHIGCAGLNQICPTISGQPLSGLRSVGFLGSMNDYTALAPETQLQYVRAFFDTKRVYSKIHGVADLYLVNFAPAFIGSPPEKVMFRPPDARYTLNAGIDIPRKGFITVGDMGPFVARTAHGPAWDEAMGRLDRLAAQANV